MRESSFVNCSTLGLLIGMALGSILGTILFVQTGQALHLAVIGLSTALGLSIGAALQPAPRQVAAEPVRNDEPRAR